ncbi:hypothetical protein QOT17_004197 [Balamuthia mandrillaris]
MMMEESEAAMTSAVEMGGASSSSDGRPFAPSPPQQHMQEESSHEFKSCPLYPNALSWDEHTNALVFTTERVIYIMDLQSPELQRLSYIKLHSTSLQLPEVGGTPLSQTKEGTTFPWYIGPLTSKGLKPAFRASALSPIGCSFTGGYLIASVTTDYRVSVHCPPHTKLLPEWKEVACLSDLLHQHYENNVFSDTTAMQEHNGSDEEGGGRKKRKARTPTKSKKAKETSASSSSTLSKQEYLYRIEGLSALALAWSPTLEFQEGVQGTLLAIGSKRDVTFWQYNLPHRKDPSLESPQQQPFPDDVPFQLVASFAPHSAWISALAWHPQDKPWLLTASVDGSVKLWHADLSELAHAYHNSGTPMAGKDGIVQRCSFSLVTEINAVDRQSVFCLSWAVQEGRTSLVFSKTFGASLRLLDDDGKIVGALDIPMLHADLVNGVCWKYDVGLLLTCAMDGTTLCSQVTIPTKPDQPESSVKGKEIVDSMHIEPTHSIESSVVCKKVIKEAGNGVFGLAYSPCALYLCCASQTPSDKDQMFGKKSPGGKLTFHNIEGFLTDVETAFIRATEKRPPRVLWDVINHLNETQQVEQYARLAALAQEQFASASRTGQIEDKLTHSKWLKSANLLYFSVSFPMPGPLKQKCSQDSFQNAHMIVQLYIYDCLQKFSHYQQKNSTTTRRPTQPKESLSLLLMADWIRVNHAIVLPELWPLALFIYENVFSTGDTEEQQQNGECIEQMKHIISSSSSSSSSSSMQVIVHHIAREQCPFCKLPIVLTTAVSETCAKGHNLARCARSLLLIETPDCWHCFGCSRKALKLETMTDEHPQQQQLSSAFSWLSPRNHSSSLPYCTMCDTPLSSLV